LLRRRVLEQEAGRAGVERGKQLTVGSVAGQYENPRLGMVVENPADRFHSVHFRHHQIHEDDVGCMTSDGCDGLVAVGGLRDDLELGIRAEQHVEPVTDDRVIVDDQDADRFGSHDRSSPRSAKTSCP